MDSLRQCQHPAGWALQAILFIFKVAFNTLTYGCMVTPEELEALDLMCWLRHGDDAARLAYCNQSTISRRSQQALQVFQPFPSHGPGPYSSPGPSTLLQMEREVHQLYRFSGRSRLRLHAPYWASRVLGNQLDASWMVNPARQKESVGAALSLLEDRVIDAMIAEASQRPADDNPRFFSFDLYEVPLVLCVDALAEKQVSRSLYCEKSLSSDDVGSLSRVRPQRFLSPESKGCVVQLFNHLYGDAMGAEAGFDQRLQESSQVTFLMAHHPSAFEDFRHFRRIDCECGFRAQESLVVLRGLEENPSILGLLETLSSSYLEPLKQHAEVIIDRAMA